MNDDAALAAHVLLSIPLAIGIAQVSSAMTRWPRNYPMEDRELAAVSRALLAKVMKAYFGCGMVDASIGGIVAFLVPWGQWPLFVSGFMMVAGAVSLPPDGIVNPESMRRVATCGRRAGYASTVSGVVLVVMAIAGRVPFTAMVVTSALLFLAAALRQWSTGAARELTELTAEV